MTRRPPRSRLGRTLRGGSDARLRVAMIFFAFLLSVCAVRLLQVQGIDPQAYAARAAADGLVHVELPAQRGDIVDRSGHVLAQSVSAQSIIADPATTKPHAAAIAKILSDQLGLDYFWLLKQLSLPKLRFAYLAHRIPTAQANAAIAAVAKLGYNGLSTEVDPLRQYPGNDLAANLIGFAQGGTAGTGLELSFNNMLKGTPGHDTYEVGAGNRIPLGENTEVKPVDGRTLKLTIDRDAQWYAQRILRSTVTHWGAKSGSLVALDTRTGQILALADYPTYDANNPTSNSVPFWTSNALAAQYEPGSVEKVATMSALIQEGLADPRTKLVVPPVVKVLDAYIHDYFTHGTIKLTLGGVIALSSNIGTVLAARAISDTLMWRYLHDFGLGQPLNIGISPETAGTLAPANAWNKLTHAQIAFGQGLAVNALQMAAMVNTVANGGLYIAPSLIMGKATTDAGDVVGSDTSAVRRVISPSTATKVASMMNLVTTQGAGTAPGAAVPGYQVAGKTGTAQEPGGPCKCYNTGFLDVSFAGFAPVGNPRFTVYVVIKHPGPGASGGGTAGPVFRRMMAYLLQKYDVPPTSAQKPSLSVYW